MRSRKTLIPVANVLFTWEMGAQLGHLDKLQALMALARREGHALSTALKDLRYADRVLGDQSYRCFQAPYRAALAPRPTSQSLSFTHTLEDFCFSEAGELFLRIKAWREIFDAVEPELIYAEYSPGALIASRGLGVPRVAVGTGFMVPPPELRNGVFAPYATTPQDRATLTALQKNDARMLSVLNAGCQRAGVPTFESLGEIFGQADRRYLATLPELDHFGWREEADYIGMQPPFGKNAPNWPIAGGPRVFCYLQGFPGLATVLKDLTDAGVAVLVYTHEPPTALKQAFRQVPNIRFTSEFIDLEALRDEARFVVHHAGHGVGIQCLMYGLPQLNIPTQQEQLLTALQLDRAGVGVTALHDQTSFAAEIRALLTEDRFLAHARRFRDKYTAFKWAQSEARILSDMAQLLGVAESA